MSWYTLVAWIKKIRRPRSVATNLDHKLVRQLRRQKLPRFTQFKYFIQFLSNSEKKLLLFFVVLSLVGAFGSAALFLSRHIVVTPGDGGEYSEAVVGQPKYLNPLFASANDVDADITPLLYNGLVQSNNDQESVPVLAEKYTVSDDGKVYNFFLRNDVRWSDGQPFSANDVLFTFEAIQNPDVGSPLANTFQGVRVEKIAPNQVRFTLKVPFAPFLKSLSVGILPEHVWSDIAPSNWRLAKNNLQPVGTGPWTFSKLTKDNLGTIQSYTLVRNENYFAQKPHLKTLTFKFFSDIGAAAEALRSQAVMAWSFVPADTRNKLPKTIADYNLNLPEYRAIFFNQTRQPILKDEDARRALGLAIDRDHIVNTVLNGDGRAVVGALVPGMLGYDANLNTNTFDLTTANQLLDKKWSRIQPEEYFKIRREEMLKNLHPSTASSTPSTTTAAEETALNESIRQEMPAAQAFYRKDKNNNLLTLVLTTADTPEYHAVAEALVTFWQALGIKTEVDYISSHQIGRERIKDRNYQMILYGEIVGSDPDLFPFWHSSQSDFPGLNLSSYANRTADKLLEDARVTLDTKKRAELYQKFQKQLSTDMPAIFLYAPSYTFAASKSLRGVTLGGTATPADRYSDLPNWYLKTSWGWKP